MKVASNLILVGPMGAGKSTIGKRLAKALEREFIDSDSEIERRTGVTIPIIFEMEGETGFRTRERAIIAELCQRDEVVLATGGGAVQELENRRNLQRSGFVIYLYTSVEEQLKRVGKDANRPMLHGAEPQVRLQQLLDLRDPLYRLVADMVVNTDGCYARRVVEKILRRLQ